MSDALKQKAADRAAQDVMPGMKLGIGTGSTAECFVKSLAARVRDGLDVIGVPTSERTRALCEDLGIKLSALEELGQLDLTVDGADEIGPGLSLIKGGGGALLREKIVAAASARMIVIADESKVVDTLGTFPLPIEVVPFGLAATRHAVEAVLKGLNLPVDLELRGGRDHPFVTDGGHYILDARLERVEDAGRLAELLVAIPGVVEHGLFVGLADTAYVAGVNDVRTLLA